MKTKHLGSYQRSCPSIKSKNEKGLKINQRPLRVLKTYVISFPPKTPQEARRHHVPHKSIPSATTRSTSLCHILSQ
jgi:hypothetical protein